MNIKASLGIFALFSTGCIAGYFGNDIASSVSNKNEEKNVSEQVRQGGEYQFINPLLECEVAEGSLDARKENFHDDLEAYVTHLKEDKKLSDVALYFRDLNNGPTFGVGEKEEFFPASLLKVPVMMAYYHIAEKEPSVLSAKIAFDKPKEFGINATIIPQENLVVGEMYTVDDLIRRMIVFSDNQALALLTDRLPLPVLQNLFAMLGIGEDVLIDGNSKLTVKEYAGFFRILFNSSYLSRESSEKALKLLTTTKYNEALPGGVPTDVIVSHKFGEAGTGDTERQLHDCGIVYFPNHPYLACIMTRGHDTETLKNSIRDISRFIYEKIDEQY